MSDKQNFYIDTSLIPDSAAASVSGQITQALKLAENHRAEFIRFSRELMSSPSSEIPLPSDLVSQGVLRFNLNADFGGIRIFAAKGTPAKVANGSLRMDTIVVALNETTSLTWKMEKNDFNTDELGILIAVREDKHV